MVISLSAGARFRALVQKQRPVQILGAVNAYAALLAQHAGAPAMSVARQIYLSGGGVAACSHGIPDLGITTMDDVVEDAKRITAVSSLPLLVDIDTGFGSAFNIARTIRELEMVGVAAVHMEDQVGAKRCGHRPNKELVSCAEMVDRIRAAVDARRDKNFVIMARTDALANEGMDKALHRAKAYVEAGADMLFPEALTQLSQYQVFTKEIPGVPILANITEFGQTPLFTKEELASVNVAMILYPLSAFRSMSAAALKTYSSILETGSQNAVVDTMQTRADLYKVLNYHDYEGKLDALFGKSKNKK